MRSVLLIAFHFPPVSISSGVHRTHKLAQYLPELGWRPLVVAPTPRVYERVAVGGDDRLPESAVVRRSFALDSTRDLAIAGRYVAASAVPDRWVSWLPAAVISAVSLWRRFRPSVIWSTYPIATTHLIGAVVSRITGVPWVADFRDPMTEEHYPKDPKLWRTFRRIESRVVRQCELATFVTAGCRDLYAERYGPSLAEKFRVVGNGFDDEDFSAAEQSLAGGTRSGASGRPLRILHSGVLYPDERDPRPLLQAIARLKSRGVMNAESVRFVFRGSGHDDYHRKLIAEAGVEDLMDLAPSVPYQEALREMLLADGLLLMQGANCNQQIPAKAYEYLRAGRPILALASPGGDTGGLLRSLGVPAVCAMEDSQAIETTVADFVASLQARDAVSVAREKVAQFSRRAKCAEMAALFAEVAESASGAQLGRRPRRGEAG